MASRRICSLLPSATEIVCALGLTDRLVAVTHECDYPPEITGLPRVTSSVIDAEGMNSREIDEAVRQALENLSTIYFIDREELGRLAPDLILTQELCQVCAVSLDRVREAAQAICSGANIVSLEPSTIEGIFETILEVGRATGSGEVAEGLVEGMRSRCATVQSHARELIRPRVLAIEWIDPLFTGGHWVPEMIEMAGGESLLARAGERSRELGWQEVMDADPDVILFMPCGYDLETTVREITRTTLPRMVTRSRAIRDGLAFAVNGSAYFNRPGPRVVDGVEIVASILHPEVFGEPAPDQAIRVEAAIYP